MRQAVRPVRGANTWPTCVNRLRAMAANAPFSFRVLLPVDVEVQTTNANEPRPGRDNRGSVRRPRIAASVSHDYVTPATGAGRVH